MMSAMRTVQTKETREAPAPRPRDGRRSWLGLLLPALLAFALLIGLGVWQIQRKAWKEGLIASLTERLAVPAEALPASKSWPQLDQADDEYRRAQFKAVFEPNRDALVYASATAF